MKKILLIFIILVSTNFVYAFPRYYNTSGNYIPVKNDINKLERKIFHQTFDYDTRKNRIERLERKVFGACQQGTLDERIILLQNAAQNYKTYNNLENNIQNQYRAPIFTGSTGSNWRNMLWGNFMNQFAGTATGYTPAMSPAMDPAYMDYFEAERAMSGTGDSYDYYNNHGYRRSNTERSSGTRVHIID